MVRVGFFMNVMREREGVVFAGCLVFFFWGFLRVLGVLWDLLFCLVVRLV